MINSITLLGCKVELVTVFAQHCFNLFLVFTFWSNFSQQKIELYFLNVFIAAE